jgi:hypothetical protein
MCRRSASFSAILRSLSRFATNASTWRAGAESSTTVNQPEAMF